jgi:pSer/pThr/pTyr-binding forkhead associated (FHA) protein
MEERAPRLLVRGGAERGREIVLTQENVTIGRQEGSDVVVGDRLASRRHARLERRQGQYLLQDCGSRNGTFVNGERISVAHMLRDGDEIQIGLEFKALYIDPEATGALLTEELVRRSAGLWVETDKREVWVQGTKLAPPMSRAQFGLLTFLQENPGRVFSRDEVVEAVWPEDVAQGVSDETIDALVGRLRRRVASVDPDHQYIVTVRGHGFKFVQPWDAQGSPSSSTP